MSLARFFLGFIVAGCLSAQPPKPQTRPELEAYVPSADARMNARKAVPVASSQKAVQTIDANERTRTNYTEDSYTIGSERFSSRTPAWKSCSACSRITTTAPVTSPKPPCVSKEPAVIDVENDILWDSVNDHRCHCGSYSLTTAEVGEDHGYLRQLYSYWWFAEADKGVSVQAETISLIDEFGAMTRALESMLTGINPEKPLRNSLASMRESMLRPGLEIPAPPQGTPACRQSSTH